MGLTIFDIKPTFEVNGENILDLTYPSIRYNYDPWIIAVANVSEMEAMRPDLLSRAAYGSIHYWDMILKYNGISNPFSLGPNDQLLIPSLEQMSDQVAPNGATDVIADSVRKQYIDVSKKAKTDPKLAEQEKKRREAQRKKAEDVAEVPSESNLPPNIAEVGDREIVIKGGKVYFGPDVSKNKRACEKPLSKSEFIAKLLKNRK
jgi:hypothetical protein